jgi:hypothetical protein
LEIGGEEKDDVSESTSEEPINLDHFESEFFRRVIRRHVDEYIAHFGERLAAIYVSGSVHRDEAVLGISDLDLHVFITDAWTEADEQWFHRAKAELLREFPTTCGLFPARPAQVILDGTWPAYLIRLRYDATLIQGRDLIEGLDVPRPNRVWARDAFQATWDLTRYAAGLESENRTDFSLPNDPPLRLRKLARLAVLGGAYLLAGLGEFRSFRGADVIPALERRFPEWTGWLEETRGLYIDPRETTPEEVAAYLSKLLTWLDWIKPQLEQDATGADTTAR